MKRTLYIAGGFTLAFLMPFNLQAQNTQPKDTTMNRTVVVEQEYNPDILDASKVNVLPKVEEPTVSKKEVEYATTFFPATSIPADLMRPYVGTEVQPGSKPGYIRAGYGNYGNLDLLANYLFRLSDRDKLNVRFQMDGMDGKLTMPEADTKWNAYYKRQNKLFHFHKTFCSEFDIINTKQNVHFTKVVSPIFQFCLSLHQFSIGAKVPFINKRD